MSWPDRRRIDPLPPPEGAFERMLESAAARRRRRRTRTLLSSAVALVLVAGGAFALGSSMRPSDHLSSTLANDGSTTQRPGSSEAATASSSASRRPHRKPGKTPVASASAKPPAPPSASTVAPLIMLRGHVTDSVGNALPGILVQPGVADSAAFVSRGSGTAVTDANGDFTIPCPRAPVYLSTWPLNQPRTASSIGDAWASAFFGPPTGSSSPVVPGCGVQRRTTALAGGATLTGVVQTVGSCPDASFPLWVWLEGNRDRTVRLTGLHAGDTFTFNGLPAGRHTLGARGETVELDLAVGEPKHQDATFSCPDVPTPTNSPTPTPDPSPSDTATTPPASPPASTSPPPVP